jgi:four helix bundle protein
MRGAASRILSDQILRAALSVPTNIVEGNAHSSPKERARYLGYALASVWEVDAHLQLLIDLDLISKQESDALQEEIVAARMMLYGLLKKVRTWKPSKRSADRS